MFDNVVQPSLQNRPVANLKKQELTRSLHPFHRDYIVPEPFER
jgi:hypothetical protein